MNSPSTRRLPWIAILLLFAALPSCGGGGGRSQRNPIGVWNLYRFNDLTTGCDETRVDFDSLTISDDGQGGYFISILDDDVRNTVLRFGAQLEGSALVLSGASGSSSVQDARWSFTGPDTLVGNLDLLVTDSNGQVSCVSRATIEAYRQPAAASPLAGRYHWTLFPSSDSCEPGGPEVVIVDFHPTEGDEFAVLLHTQFMGLPDLPLIFQSTFSGSIVRLSGSDQIEGESATLSNTTLAFDPVSREMAGELTVAIDNSEGTCTTTFVVAGLPIGDTPAGPWNALLRAEDRNDFGFAASWVQVNIRQVDGGDYEVAFRLGTDDPSNGFDDPWVTFGAQYFNESLQLLNGRRDQYVVREGGSRVVREVELTETVNLRVTHRSSGNSTLAEGDLAIVIDGPFQFTDTNVANPGDQTSFEGDLTLFFEDGTLFHPLSLQLQSWNVDSGAYVDNFDVIFIPLNDADVDLDLNGTSDRFAVAVRSATLAGELFYFLADASDINDGSQEIEIESEDFGSFATYMLIERGSVPLRFTVSEFGQVSVSGRLRLTIPSLGVFGVDTIISG